MYISPNGYLGGAERFVLNAVLAHKNSNKVEAGILFFSNGEAVEEARRLGLTFTVLKNTFRIRNLWKLFLGLIEIRQLVIKYDPEILHLTMPYSHIVLSLATISLSLKKVWFQHGPVGERLDKIASLFSVDMLWFNSQFLKAQHHQSWPSTRVKMQEAVINLGVKASLESREIFSQTSLTIGTAGRICHGKGFHHIITALGELKSEGCNSSYQFLIAGSAKGPVDQEYARKLTKLVQTYKLEKEIIFFQHVEDMQNFYQSLDVFIHSSVIPEPFGLVVAEAMANGCLVIASDMGGVTALVENSITGLTFPATENNAVVKLKKILKEIILTTDKNEINRFRLLAKKGKEHVEINFSLGNMNSQIEELYSQLSHKTV